MVLILIYCLIVIIAVTILSVFVYLYLTSSYEHVNGKYTVKQSVKHKLGDMYNELTSTFEKNNITNYVLLGNSMKSVHENNKLFSDNTDTLSIGIFVEDLRNFLKIIDYYDNATNLYRLKKQRTNGTYTFACNNFNRYPCIDIVILSEKEAHVTVCSPLSVLGECTYVDAHIFQQLTNPTESVLPLNRRNTIDGYVVNMVNEPEKCIKRYISEIDEYDKQVSVKNIIINKNTTRFLDRILCR